MRGNSSRMTERTARQFSRGHAVLQGACAAFEVPIAQVRPFSMQTVLLKPVFCLRTALPNFQESAMPAKPLFTVTSVAIDHKDGRE